MTENSDDKNKQLEKISEMIWKKSEGKIPKDKCDAAARRIINRKKYNDSIGKKLPIEQYVDDFIWAFFQ